MFMAHIAKKSIGWWVGEEEYLRPTRGEGEMLVSWVTRTSVKIYLLFYCSHARFSRTFLTHVSHSRLSRTSLPHISHTHLSMGVREGTHGTYVYVPDVGLSIMSD